MSNDYLGLILNCFKGDEVFGESSFAYREPESYLIGAYEAAKTKGVTLAAFLGNCEDVIDSLIKDLNSQVSKKKLIASIELSKIDANPTGYPLGKGETLAQAVKSLEDRLDGARIQDCEVYLPIFTRNAYRGRLNGERVLRVATALSNVKVYFSVKKQIKRYKKNALLRSDPRLALQETRKIIDSLEGLNFTEANILVNKFSDVYLEICEGFKDSDATKQETEQGNSHIFVNNGYQLFDYLLKNHTIDYGRKKIIHFYYHQLKKHKFIVVKHKPFIDWFEGYYNEELGDTVRELDTKTKTRTDTYFKGLLDMFKQQ